MPLSALVGAPARAAREGVAVSQVQEYLFQILDPIMAAEPEGRAIYQVDGRPVRAGDVIRLPEVGDLLDRLGAEGPEFLYTGDVAAAVSDWVLERGGLLTRDDLASYEVVEREPARAQYRGARGDHQPAALVGRHPDRLCARPARAAAAAPATCARWWR